MTEDHAAALYDLWCHPEVALWLDMPPLSSAADAEHLIGLLRQMAREEASLRWSIIGPEGDVIGSCGYNYWQLPGAYRGKSAVSCHRPIGGRDICRKRWSL